MLSRSGAVRVVRGWIGTPYQIRGTLPGAGLDCCTLLCEYLIQIGRLTRAEVYQDFDHYTSDWFLHAKNERYLRGLMRFGTMTAERICRSGVDAKPGDIALFKVAGSKLYNHGAVVTAWPLGVHAQANGVREVDLATCPLTSFRKIELLDPFEGA